MYSTCGWGLTRSPGHQISGLYMKREGLHNDAWSGSLLFSTAFIRVDQTQTDNHPVCPLLSKCSFVFRLLCLFLEEVCFDLLGTVDLAGK